MLLTGCSKENVKYSVNYHGQNNPGVPSPTTENNPSINVYDIIVTVKVERNAVASMCCTSAPTVKADRSEGCADNHEAPILFSECRRRTAKNHFRQNRKGDL